MRILLIHPNYHSGGAEIAGNWPPAWVAYLTGYLKQAGYHDITFVDAMTHHLTDDQVRARITELKPDIVGCTAITPAIYKAEGLLKIAKEVNPEVVTVLGGIHGTFMYPQVLKEAPWIDAIVRGEGEHLPAALASRVLLTAIRRHAWTFAGSGEFTARAGQPVRLTIRHNPLCVGVESGEPSCAFYTATFERLFRVLVHPDARVRERQCESMGAPACVFEVAW